MISRIQNRTLRRIFLVTAYPVIASAIIVLVAVQAAVDEAGDALPVFKKLWRL